MLGRVVFALAASLVLVQGAVASEITLDDASRTTGLSRDSILKSVEASLETLHFYEADGRSCGLESFNYQTSVLTPNALQPSKLVIETEVVAPVYECKGYRTYVCESTFVPKSTGWSLVETTCED